MYTISKKGDDQIFRLMEAIGTLNKLGINIFKVVNEPSTINTLYAVQRFLKEDFSEDDFNNSGTIFDICPETDFDMLLEKGLIEEVVEN